MHNVSDREKANRDLQESETRFRFLVENAPDGIFMEIERCITFVNSAMLRIYAADRPEQLVGQLAMTLFHPENRDQILDRIHREYKMGQAMNPHDEVHLRLDGQPVYVNVTAVPLMIDNRPGSLVFIRDMSDRRRLEQEKALIEVALQQQQKLEAIGTLAGGVAHEINNPINGIMNYAQLILDTGETGKDTAVFASEIIHESQRISVIVKSLLQFSRQEKSSHSIANIEDIVGQTMSLIRTIIQKDHIQLSVSLDEGLPPLKCRSQQIQQVIMNLLTNARDSLNEKYPEFNENKAITIEAHAFENDGRRWIRLTVTDRGLGIPPDIAGKIFNPFFSTKTKDQGTGLGLAIS